jgi:hypothetical protein
MPMADDDKVNTTRATPHASATAITVSVPPTLTENISCLSRRNGAATLARW